MFEYELFGEFDLVTLFQSICNFMLDAYASGETGVCIYLQSALARDCIFKWSPGWLRKAGPGGEWRDSQGNLQNIQFECFANLLLR